MHFLKENKKIYYFIFMLPLFLFYLDRIVIEFFKDFQESESRISTMLQNIDPLINFISNGLTLLVTILILLIISNFFFKRLYYKSQSLLIGFLTSGIIVQIIKHLTGRARPRLTENLIFVGPSFKSGYDSFPSGHTAVAFCLAYILSHYYPRCRILLYITAFIIGFDRIEDVAHFPSDVLVGALVGILVAKILIINNFYSQTSPKINL